MKTETDTGDYGNYVQIRRQGNRPRYTAVYLPTGESLHEEASHLQAITDAVILAEQHGVAAYDIDGEILD
jgi:hypothetical protein